MSIGFDNFKDLQDFAARFPREAGELLRRVVAEAHRKIHARTLQLAKALSAPAYRTGRLQNSWVSAPADPESAIQSGQPTSVKNIAPYAQVISMGRATSKPYVVKRGGKRIRVTQRAIGSTKIPHGIRAPVLRTLKAEEAEILAHAEAVAREALG